MLLTDTDAAAAMWIGPETLLVRSDLPGDDGRHAALQEALRAAGFDLLDEDSLSAPAIAIQALGIRFSSWDLWGSDLEAGFADLRQGAAGEGDLPVIPGPRLPGPDLPFEPFQP